MILPEISIHAPRTGSDSDERNRASCSSISIHAPRTGSDALRASARRQVHYFNPRSPHGERRLAAEATTVRPYYFNPRSPHGERQQTELTLAIRSNFNPRSPHGERLPRVDEKGATMRISIHAPRTGSDVCRAPNRAGTADFNPRSPHGERQHSQHATLKITRFQSTLPARGATFRFFDFFPNHGISIHAPRTGSDGQRFFRILQRWEFQSTLPARGATLSRPCAASSR